MATQKSLQLRLLSSVLAGVVCVETHDAAFGNVLVGLQLCAPVPHALGCAFCLQQ